MPWTHPVGGLLTERGGLLKDALVAADALHPEAKFVKRLATLCGPDAAEPTVDVFDKMGTEVRDKFAQDPADPEALGCVQRCAVAV